MKEKTCFHEAIGVQYFIDKKKNIIYTSRDGLEIYDIWKILVSYWDKKEGEYSKSVYVAVTNYGLKVCINIPDELKEKALIDSEVITKDNPKKDKKGKLVDDNVCITLISWFKDKKKEMIPQEPLVIWFDRIGNVINKHRIIDFKYNKFIEKCDDYISDMKVKDLERIVGELGSVTAVCLMDKLNKFLRRNFIKRSKKNE